MRWYGFSVSCYIEKPGRNVGITIGMETVSVFDVLQRRSRLIAALCVVTTIAGYGVTFLKPLIPVKYEASAVVLVRPHEQVKIGPAGSGKEFLDFPVAQTPVVESASKTYIQIIESPELIGKVVRELDLDHEPVSDAYADDTILARIAASMDRIFNEVTPYIKNALSILKYGKVVQGNPFDKAVGRIGRGLTLKAYEDTYVFEIKYSDSDPTITANVANTIAKLFIQFMEDMRTSEAKASANRLQRELDESRQRLVDARETLQKYKEANGVFLYQPEYDEKLKVISDLTVELAKLDAAYANENLGANTIEGATYAKKRDRLLKALTENQTDLASLPMVERQLQLLQSDVDVANSTYGTVARELKDAELKSDALPEARLISPAWVPEVPSRPRRGVIAMVSLVAGLLGGVVLAFLLEYFNRTARGVSDIESFVGLKVIGTIPEVALSLPVDRAIGGG